MKRVRIPEIAQLAGVSTATVDRVLHGRGGFSAKSAEKVKSAIEQLGYKVAGDRFLQPQKQLIQMSLFIPTNNRHQREAIETEAHAAAVRLCDAHVQLDVHDIGMFDCKQTVEALRGVDTDVTDCVCLFAIDAPGVREAIDQLVNDGVHVCTLMSDVPTSRRFAYVGPDNVSAGRTAGRMIGRFLKEPRGTVGIITGSNQIRDHIERCMGLTQSLSMHQPDLLMLPASEGHGSHELTEKLTKALLEDHPDLVALYSTAAGNEGIVKALRNSGRAESTLLVVHELDSVTRNGLSDGTIDLVLHHDTNLMMRAAIEALVDAVRGRVTRLPAIPINLFVAENLP